MEMKRHYALLGEKLGHTMSPPIHKALFELRGRDFKYDIFEVPPEELKDEEKYLRSLAGFNITIPHKVAIIDIADELDETAERYNSVNCIVDRGGVLIGYNTDCVGFLETVRAMDVPLSGKVLLIGCGGVGRMMAIEAALAGADLTIAVLESDIRLAEQAVEDIRKLSASAKVEIVLSSGIDVSQRYDLLMNACPVGMYPKVNACPVSDDVIAAADAVFDVIYNPKNTRLIEKAKALGKKTAGGMAMLVWQAVKAHEIWDGDTYTDAEVAAIIAEMEEMVENFNK